MKERKTEKNKRRKEEKRRRWMDEGGEQDKIGME